MPRPLAAVSLALALLAVAAAAGCKPSTEQTPPAGNIADALRLPTLDGLPYDPAALAGKPAIVMFWRTGCKYCLNELPSVAKAAAAHDAAAIAVMINGSQGAARRLAQDFRGTILVDDGTLRERYDVRKVPYTLILRPDGTAARAFLGEQSEATLAAAVRAVK